MPGASSAVMVRAMLQFRIGSIPVVVRPSHLLIAALISWDFMGVQKAPDSQSALLAGLAGILVVFISILVHELGHALSMRAFGYRPSIVIEWFGGHTSPNTDQPITWWKDVLLTFAGPMAGLALGIGAFVGLEFMGPRDPTVQSLPVTMLTFLAWANVVWTVLNLVPVLPLDGGRISHAILTRIFGRRGVLFSQGLSLLLSVAAIAAAVNFKQPMLAVFFGMFGYRAFQLLSAYFRGQDDVTAPHPSELAFEQASAHFREGRLEDARRIATRGLQVDPPPQLSARNRLHHLLGWIHLKDGRGTDALDHFARIEKENVEAHALAAAFSLAGDDERALPLWELATRTGEDATLMHEYAGALIRRGRVEEARRLPKIDMLAAWRAAERVASIRGDYETAARLGREALMEFPRPDLAYDTACALARAGKVSEAQQMLEHAAELGFRDGMHAAQDSDLDALRSTAAFQSWLSRVQEIRPS